MGEGWMDCVPAPAWLLAMAIGFLVLSYLPCYFKLFKKHFFFPFPVCY